ncbi:uncharacterized protein RSE6_04467 [Rhynchosporium secalis]|uniref:Uncharacterized protein n=1 Tax=Rhynchosporium secalis TaxID=38038 RepID=A0A1E1M5E0_RHYSE|nr:uncharacterized protein RSE6_04467 [Rhynchosporium secalis]
MQATSSPNPPYEPVPRSIFQFLSNLFSISVSVVVNVTVTHHEKKDTLTPLPSSSSSSQERELEQEQEHERQSHALEEKKGLSPRPSTTLENS